MQKKEEAELKYAVAVLYLFSLFYVTLGSRATLVTEVKYAVIGLRALRWDDAANVFLFIPWGVLAAQRRVKSCKYGRKIFWDTIGNFLFCMSSGFAGSGFIEGFQFFTQRGYCEANDLLCNAAGSLLGYFLYNLVRFVYSKRYTLPFRQK